MSKVFISAGKLAFSSVLLAAGLYADSGPVTPVGAYTNIVVTGEHADGYSLELWQQSGVYSGLFISAAGLSQDAPAGLLEDLRVDPKARTITFKARLSVSQESMNGESWEPTRDLYQFSGTLYPDQITGTLVHVNVLHPESRGRQEEIKLYRSKTEEEAMQKFDSNEGWTEWARSVLQARGPKW
jgi:hypothetical protein